MTMTLATAITAVRERLDEADSAGWGDTEIRRGINEAVTDPARPRAVIIISSYLPELFGVCDRIAVMSQGKLTRAVPVADLTPHDVMLVATGKAADLPQPTSSPRS